MKKIKLNSRYFKFFKILKFFIQTRKGVVVDVHLAHVMVTWPSLHKSTVTLLIC